jgi:hypothetical protein
MGRNTDTDGFILLGAGADGSFSAVRIAAAVAHPLCQQFLGGLGKIISLVYHYGLSFQQELPRATALGSKMYIIRP